MVIAEESAARGKTLSSFKLLERAIQTMNLSREDLLTLWVTLESTLMATRTAANKAIERGTEQP